MKVLQGLFLFGAVLAFAGCGASQPTAQPVTYGSTATGASTGNNGNQPSAQSPLYNNGQLIGYKTRTPLFTGVQANIVNSAFFEQVSVQAGDRLVINSQFATFTVQQAFCNGVLVTVNSNTSRPLPYLSFTYNGQAVGSGTIVPAAGTVSIQATLGTYGMACAWGTLQNVEYIVSLSDYYSGTPALAVDRCTTTTGASFACPY